MKFLRVLYATAGLITTAAAAAIDPLLSYARTSALSGNESIGPEMQFGSDVKPFDFDPDEKNLARRTMWADPAYRGITVWPPNQNARSGDKALNAIFYCYVNDESRNLLKPNVDIAIYQWYTRLGGGQHIGPSPQAGHAIFFLELNVNCYGNDYQSTTRPGTWQLPAGYEDALAIHKGTGYLAHMGYQPANRAQPPNKPGRHYLELIPLDPPAQGQTSRELRNYFHEFGHGNT